MLAWDAKTLERQLAPWLPGVVVEVRPECGSTNTELLQLARHGGEPFAPRLLVAEQQTAGRGRLGRHWLSEPGASLTFSLALPLAASDWSGLSLAVGLAVAEAFDPHDAFEPTAGGPSRGGDGPAIGLKWPNDLWLADGCRDARPETRRDARGRPPPVAVSGGKWGGILIETVNRGAQRLAVVGIGLNIRPVAAQHAAALGRTVGCLQQIEPAITAPAALARVAPRLAQALRRFEEAGFGAFASAYARRDVLRGQAVVTTDAGVGTGVAEGVDADGALLVRGAGRLHRITSGEVSVRAADVPAMAACAAVANAERTAAAVAATATRTGAA